MKSSYAVQLQRELPTARTEWTTRRAGAWLVAVATVALSALAGLPAAALAAPTADATSPDGAVASDSVLVRSGSLDVVADLLADGIAASVEEIPATGFLEVVTRSGSAESLGRALTEAGAAVEPNVTRRAFLVPNDPAYGGHQAAYLGGVRLPAAWDRTTGADDLVVAVVDTGVDLNHPDLASRLVAGFDFVHDDAVPEDEHGHGTMVAGIVAARTNNGLGTAGVLWRGRVMPIKVLDATGAGTDADISAGIVWAADHGADVINLSLGGPGGSSVLQAAVDHARTRGAVVVAAAGNESTAEPQWPAAAAGVVAVGATTSANTLASFSNHGDWVDLVAPGVNITSTSKGGAYASGSGTSFAAPIVAGIAALARAADPAVSSGTIAGRLVAKAMDLGLPGVDALFGAGLVDAAATAVLPVLAPVTPSAPAAPTTPAKAPTPAPAPATAGYWMLGADGRVWGFGDARTTGEPTAALGGAAATDIEPTRDGAGYWVLGERGDVFPYGAAAHLGAPGSGALLPGETATSLSSTPTGRGYWVFSSRGRVFAFGDASFHGDMRAVVLNGPVIGSVATPTGRGYWMVASDGGIFSFGDAQFHGSTGAMQLNQPVRGLVPDPDGAGYWLVAADGGVFAFDAGFRGSMGHQRLNAPVAGMVAYGDGYLMVGADGGIFSFSDKPFVGSLGATPPPRPVVAVAVLG